MRPSLAPPSRAADPRGEPALAVLLAGADLAAAERRCRDALPHAAVWSCPVPIGDGGRGAMLRRFFAEAEADIYVLALDAGPDDVDAVSRLAAAVDGGLDLAALRHPGGPGRGPGAWALARATDFAFGHGGETLFGDVVACSRRLVGSYRRAPATAGRPELSLALHALRLRLPTGSLEGPPAAARTGAPDRFLTAVALAARILAEERPRRSFGLLGLALVAAGIGLALPGLALAGGRAALAPGAGGLATLALIGAGAASGAAGLLLDAVAAARQEVTRVGLSALPGLADGYRQSSVS